MRPIFHAALLLFLAPGFAQVGPSEKPSEAVLLETFEGPKELPTGNSFDIPFSVIQGGEDGWVNLSMMISPEGKPFEIMVTESSGNRELEKFFLRQARSWRFTPATLNGIPVESAHELKYTVRLRNARISKKFSNAYDLFTKELETSSKEESAKRLDELKPKNLFEGTFFGLANYHFAKKWGSEADQLFWIKRTIAKEKKAIYMTDDLFLSALRTQFGLQAKTFDLAGALETWGLLLELTKDPGTLDPLRSTVAEIEALRVDKRAYSVSGTIGSESWKLGLLKRHFAINVVEGHISQLKLRCKKKYIYFDFDPDLQYNIAESAGSCSLEVVGDPDTKFELIQS